MISMGDNEISSSYNLACLLVLCVANLVLQDTIERVYAGNLYAEVPRGIFLVRGENVLLLGEVVCVFGRQLSFANGRILYANTIFS